MNPIDTYRYAFLKFVKEGMSYSEALAQFDREEWNKAMFEEIDSGEAARCIDPSTFRSVPNNGKLALLDLAAMAGYEESDANAMEQATELWEAGWTSEDISPPKSNEFWSQTHTMSLYWRRPPRRPGKPGRLFLSTNQAYMAMKRNGYA